MRRRLSACFIVLLLLPCVASAQATQTFLQVATDMSDLTTYTFAAQNIGAAAAGRCVGVGVVARATGATAFSISSLTVAGNTVSNTVPIVSAGTNSTILAIGAIVVPTGTTADFVLTLNRAAIHAGLIVWRATGTDCTIADSGTSTATDPTFALDVPDDGIALAACSWAQGTATTWTGLSEDADTVFTGNVHQLTGAGDDFASPQTDLSITCNSTATVEPAGVFMSLGPSAAAPASGRMLLMGVGP